MDTSEGLTIVSKKKNPCPQHQRKPEDMLELPNIFALILLGCVETPTGTLENCTTFWNFHFKEEECVMSIERAKMNFIKVGITQKINVKILDVKCIELIQKPKD